MPTREPITNRPVRVAMIGAGRMANNVHYPSLASFDDAEIAAICDLAEGPLNATADKYGVDTDYRKMVAEVQPDGVYVIGQPHYMYDIWVWCLREGLNLYIEKPMGLTWHQAQMLAHLAEQKSVITQVSHQRRSSPLFVKLRQECLKRGPIVHAVCEFYKPGPSPFIGPRDHMMDDTTHAIDTIRWICGGDWRDGPDARPADVVAIESECKRIGTPDINWIGATLRFSNGSTGFVVNSWSSGRRVFRVEMHAPGIAVDADVEGKAYLYTEGDTNGQEYTAQQVAGGDQTYVFGGFKAKNREFIDSLKSGKELTSSPFRDCVKTMEVAEKILAQALLARQ